MEYPGRLLKRGDTGDAVALIQRRLSVQPTGLYGPTTETCVRVFQRAHGLAADGIVGPLTWRALFGAAASSDLAERALQIAKSKVGQREATGRNDGSFVRMLQRWAAKGYAWLDNQPWCVMFATWCVHEAARELGISSRIPERASSSRLYRWYRSQGLLLSQPAPGCVGMVRKGHATGSDAAGGTTHTHTFLVTEVEGRYVHGIDGNYRNAVGYSRRPISACDFGQIV